MSMCREGRKVSAQCPPILAEFERKQGFAIDAKMKMKWSCASQSGLPLVPDFPGTKVGRKQLLECRIRGPYPPLVKNLHARNPAV